MANELSILICTERGILENMSKILVSSIRKFGGAVKDCPIYSFQPRKSQRVSDTTKKFFERNDVEFIDLELNSKYKFYPLANKPLVCAWAEANIESERLLFLDSDVVVLKEPIEFLDVGDGEVRISPVDIKGIGSSGIDDENMDYWHSLYDILAVESKEKVQTQIDKQNILAYWNSGHIAVKRSAMLFEYWKLNFENVIAKKLTPSNGLFFLEQSTLAATITKLGLKANSFTKHYNYPIHFHYQLERQNGCIDLNETVSWHYHDLFSKSAIPKNIHQFLLYHDKGKWLNQKLKEYRLDVSIFKRNLKSLNQYKHNLLFKLIY